MAAAPDRLVCRKAVKSFGPGVPELDRPIEMPREHRLIGQCEQIDQTLGSAGGPVYFGRLAFHLQLDFAGTQPDRAAHARRGSGGRGYRSKLTTIECPCPHPFCGPARLPEGATIPRYLRGR